MADVKRVKDALAELQSRELSIIRLSEPLSSADPAKRSSDASDELENPSPSTLAADLEHYKAGLMRCALAS
jgi:hypothetical protein